ncbi:MAG: hypothetical protein J0I06_01745 [Planctomycetes bacterium]|nr:hypothetical protein [Planctomycetota bacterium]
MDGKVRFGRWILVAIIVVTALVELALTGLSLQAGRFRGNQIGRVLLTGWLLWRVWDGAGWARWVLAALSLVTAGLAGVFVVASPITEGRPELVAVLIGVGVVTGAFGIGLASPWVGAYQAARRGSPGADPDPAGM